jgi:DNA polymerase-3 subunit gamma/tau
LTPEIPAKKKSKSFIIPAGFFAGKVVVERLDSKSEFKANVVNKVDEKSISSVPVTEVAEKNISTYDNRSRKKSILSLKSIGEKKQNSKKKDVSVDYDSLPKAPFTNEEFSVLWKENIEKLNSKNQKLFASLLSAVSFRVKDDFKIELTLPNARMQQEIEKSKGKTLQFFREKLQNFTIDFIYIVNEEQEKKFAYTPQEKYALLKEKNPLIFKLRKSLDLDV